MFDSDLLFFFLLVQVGANFILVLDLRISWSSPINFTHGLSNSLIRFEYIWY